MMQRIEMSWSVEVRSVHACSSQSGSKVTSERWHAVELPGDRSMHTESSRNNKAEPHEQPREL